MALDHRTFVLIFMMSRLGSQTLDTNLAASFIYFSKIVNPWEATIYSLQTQKVESHRKPSSVAEHGLFLFYISDLLISVIFIL